jgi:hypothetical protein
MEWPKSVSIGNRFVSGFGSVHRLVRVESDDCVDGWVNTLDLDQVRFHHFDRRDFPIADFIPDFSGVQVANLIASHVIILCGHVARLWKGGTRLPLLGRRFHRKCYSEIIVKPRYAGNYIPKCQTKAGVDEMVTLLKGSACSWLI